MNFDICDGCGLKDCSPTYNSYANLVLCDSCYESAEREEHCFDDYDEYDLDQYHEWEEDGNY